VTNVESLRRKTDFDAVYKHGRIESSRVLVVRVRPSPPLSSWERGPGGQAPTRIGPTRVGYVTTKTLGNAVVRNRIKRRLRAATAALDLKDGLDIVISARKPAANEPYASLATTLRTLLTRAQALSPPIH
jgi:ribonuclease P protein component